MYFFFIASRETKELYDRLVGIYEMSQIIIIGTRPTLYLNAANNAVKRY